MRDKTEEIRAVVDKYDRFDLIPLRIEDAFSNEWWGKIGGKPVQQDLGADVTNEGKHMYENSYNLCHLAPLLDLFLSTIAGAGDTDSPTARLKNYISSLPTQTAIPSAVRTLTRLLLLHTAMATGSSHLLLGTSLTSLSISLISSISQGGGFVVREEAQEEWTPRVSVNTKRPNGHKNGTVRTVRPLRDIGVKECGIWAWWNGLEIIGRERFPGGRQNIGTLTKGELCLP
jgi:cytoplasmic tRNA 2-thiolation protein 2